MAVKPKPEISNVPTQYNQQKSKLSTIREVVEIVALLALIALCVIIAYYALKTAPRVRQTVEDLDRSVIIIGATATNLEKASRVWQQASQDQASVTSKAMSNVSAAAAAVTSLAFHTDSSINSNLIPSLTATVRDQNAQLVETQHELQKQLAGVGAVTASTQQMIVDADVQIKNPDIAATFKSVAVTTDQAAKTMTKVQEGVTYEVNEIMKPVKKVKVALEFAATIIGKLLGL